MAGSGQGMRVHDADGHSVDTGGDITYPSVAAMLASDQGFRAYRSGIKCFINDGPDRAKMFVLDRLSTAVPNGTTIFASPGGGNWLLFADPGGGGDTLLVTEVIPFAFNTPSPIVVEPVPAGSKFIRASVFVTTHFDDPASSLELGTPGTPQLVLRNTDSELWGPDETGYDSFSVIDVPAADTIEISLSPGASVQGAGFVVYQRTVP